MANSSLLAIQNKVRLLTRSLTEAQLTTDDLNQYINTYVLYDFPMSLKLFNLRTTFSFYTTPFVDVYSTNDKSSPLYNFTNKYTFADAPIYIAGYPALFSQSRTQFFGIYPLTNSIAQLPTYGDGIETNFQGVINAQQANTTYTQNNQLICLLQRNVLFSGIDNNLAGVAMQDSPILDLATNRPTIYGLLYNPYIYNDQPADPVTNPNGYPVLKLAAPYITSPDFPNGNVINYVTGQYSVTFQNPPRAGSTINSQTVPMNPSIPQSILFYDGQFTVRPVPNQPYRVDMEVFIQPTELLAEGQMPELSEWWQLIAFNAAKKVLEDRLDYETINTFMPSLKEQENLVIYRTVKQNSTQRAATIYSQQSGIVGTYGNGWMNGGWNF